MTYGIRIDLSHLPYKKQRPAFAQATACMKRYSGQFDPATKMWLFDERAHAACTNWGDIIELDDPVGVDRW